MKSSDLFNFRDAYAKGRSCMLMSAPLNKIIINLSQGALYSAFLAANSFSIVEVGTLGYIAFLASCLSFISPGILERVERRRYLLAGILFSYYLVFLLGLSVSSVLVTEHNTKFLIFAVLIFTGSLLEKISTSGYSAWHLKFIPDSVRARYYLFQQRIQIPVSALSLILLSSLVDYVHTLPNELYVQAMIRAVGFLLGLLNIFILLQPAEFPYAKKEGKFSFESLIRVPLKNKRFSRTIFAMAIWSAATSLTESAWVYYLLNTIGTGTQIQNVYTVVYSISLIVLGGCFTRIYQKFRWIRTFCIMAFIHVPTFFLCAFVSKENYWWLYTGIMAVRGIEGVGLNITFDNLTYVNMPEYDQTYYLSFSALATSIACFLGQFIGTIFLKAAADATFIISGRSFDAVQILLMIQTAGAVLCPVYLMKNRKKLEPLYDT